MVHVYVVTLIHVRDCGTTCGTIFASPSEENFANQTLEHHLQVMYELIQRDKNRPSAVMWSLANEPHSSFPVAVPYFK